MNTFTDMGYCTGASDYCCTHWTYTPPTTCLQMETVNCSDLSKNACRQCPNCEWVGDYEEYMEYWSNIVSGYTGQQGELSYISPMNNFISIASGFVKSTIKDVWNNTDFMKIIKEERISNDMYDFLRNITSVRK